MAGNTTAKAGTKKKTTAKTAAGKAAADKDVQVAAGVVATDNVPEGALTPNEDGSVNTYDADGNKTGTVTPEEAAAAEAAAAKALEEQQNAGKVKVKAAMRYLDKQLNEIVEAGTEFVVSRQRADELVRAKVAKIVE